MELGGRDVTAKMMEILTAESGQSFTTTAETVIVKGWVSHAADTTKERPRTPLTALIRQRSSINWLSAR